MNSANATSSFAVQVFEPDSEVAYTIETVSRITRIPRHTIAVYCRHRLVRPVIEPEQGGWFFDSEGICALRRIEHLRAVHGASLGTIGLILGLMRQVEDLQEQLRFLRL